MADNPFEIPRTLCDLAEQNVKQAHAAYEQLTDFVTKATGAWTGALPSNAITHGFKEVQERAVQIAKENAEFAFALAGKLAKAQHLPGGLDPSNAVRSRPDKSFRHADAGARQAGRRSVPEVSPQLICCATVISSLPPATESRRAPLIQTEYHAVLLHCTIGGFTVAERADHCWSSTSGYTHRFGADKGARLPLRR